mmetsp:Transcript_114962/g.371536  ORF Transcript_114962/g.371536 Transcript_114962/m.371536 type:complete len:318 (-) Transcript_114962:9-962(-)
MRQAEAADPLEHAVQRLSRAVLHHLGWVHVLVEVLDHLLLAPLHGPILPEVPPVTDEEVKGLERPLNLRLGQLLLALLELARGLPDGRLGEAHEVGEVLDLVLLDLHVYVVDLLGGEHGSEAKDCRGLLLGHAGVPRALRVHQQERDGTPVDAPQEGLGPDPDALGAGVHAAFEAEAAAVLVAGAVYDVARGGDPPWQGELLATAAWRCVRRAASGVAIVAQVPQEEIQEEGLPGAEGAHDGHDGDFVRADLPKVGLETSQGIFVDLHLLLLHVETHQLQGAAFAGRGRRHAFGRGRARTGAERAASLAPCACSNAA